MKKNSGSLPAFVWPVFLVLAAVSILLLSVSDPDLQEVETPVPPHLLPSSYQLLATGNRLGTYYPTGHIMVDWLNSHLGGGKEVFKTVETNGSVDNVKLLAEKKVLLAMVESRIVKEAAAGADGASLRLVWPLWPDVVHLVLAPGIVEPDFSALEVGFLGQTNSSTFRTSREIFSTMGVEPRGAPLSTERVLAELSAGKIQFAVIQAGIPNRTVSDALIFHNCSLMNLNEDLQQKLMQNVSTSWQFDLPAGYYGDRQALTHTLGIPNVLVTTAEASDDVIERITEMLCRASQSLRIRHQAFADVPGNFAQARAVLDEIAVPVHPGALRWLEKLSAANETKDVSEVTETGNKDE